MKRPEPSKAKAFHFAIVIIHGELTTLCGRFFGRTQIGYYTHDSNEVTCKNCMRHLALWRGKV